MPTLLRLYIDLPLADGLMLPLGQTQSHYLLQVMRRTEGDQIELFNGRDGGFVATITRCSKRDTLVMLGEQLRSPANEYPLRLCFAAIKRGPMEMIVQKATELGVTTLQPMVTTRTTAKSLNHQRLMVIAIEAAEQCERVSVPHLAEPIEFGHLLDALAGPVIFADEAGDNADQPWGGPEGRAMPMLGAISARADLRDGLTLLIGPEGGFSPEERSALRARENIIPVSLGPRILRADTAAIAALTLVQASVGDWRG